MNKEELEGLRLELRNAYIIAIVVIVVVLLISILFIKSIFIPMVIIILGIVITMLITSKKRQQYQKGFKDYFVLSSLNQYFEELTYKPEQGMPYETIANTKMMNMGDRYHSNDYMKGKYKNICFEQADVHIEEEETTTDSDGHTTTSYVTIFKGRWMIFDFNKSFKANVQVSQKGFGNSKIQLHFGKKEQLYKKVSMESEEFNKKFKVYAQNEHDAFYILTPSLMERIERLEENNKGKLLLCFIENKLHIGLYDGKDSFEAGSVFKAIDEEKVREEIEKDIKTITQFVDELNLDNTLFREEV